MGRRAGHRRLIRASLTWLMTGILALCWGVFAASYTGAVGPHTAHYSTTLNSEVRFDMGPLGSLILDSPLPLGLGVDVRVGQIPDELTVEGQTFDAGADQAVAALTADLESYTQFFLNPGEAIQSATDGLVSDALSRTILMWSLLLTTVLLGRLAAHGILRSAVASAFRQPGVPFVAGSLAVVLVLIPVWPATKGSSGLGRTSTVFEGTALEEARITGRLGALLDHYGQVVIEEIEENEHFYAEVSRNFTDVLDEDDEVLAPSKPPLPMPSVDGETRQVAPPDQTTTDEFEESDTVTLVVVSDLHCNVGMGKVAGEIAHQVQADLILNLGDNVMGGTAVEGVCIDSFAESFGDIPVVAANGNHDSATTTAQQYEHGWHVLDGEAIEIEGIRFLGDEDPTLTTLGEPTRLVADETIQERGQRLADTACHLQDEGKPVDILALHNPQGTEEALDSGCVDYAFSGHFHRQIGPWQKGLGVQYIHTSTAGAVLGKPTIGPLNGVGGVSAITWDTHTKEPTAIRFMRALPDNSVEVTSWYGWPEIPSSPVHHEWPTPQEAPWP